MWWDHDIGWAGSLAMTLGMAAFWGLVALLVVVGVRAGRRPDEDHSTEAALDPRQILERRLARGEIDVEDFRRRLATIERPSTSDASPPPTSDDGQDMS